jgi:LysW-gamma-L-lysine carboxypeptidase
VIGGPPARASSPPDRGLAEELLGGLVAIPSPSGAEGEAAAWLAERLPTLGFERAGVDACGNAVGELGAADASRVVLLLGHIDTVAGAIPVRRGNGCDGGDALWGRGAVDAKGPLCALACGAARFGAEAARSRGLRVVVAGAVEEEVPGSRGARFLARRFDGSVEQRPAACVIGEPSRWDRLTIGYKGSLVIELEAERPMSHGAGPERGVACAAFDLWSTLERFADEQNRPRSRLFDQVLPTLRSVRTSTDGLRERVAATFSSRLPPEFAVATLAATLAREVERLCGARVAVSGDLAAPESALEVLATGHKLRCKLRFHGLEAAYRAPAASPLSAAFLAAIRGVGEDAASPPSPRFVLKTGTSDMNVVGPVFGCPILAYGPGDSSLDHTPDEHLELDEYWRSVRVIEEALRRL